MIRGFNVNFTANESSTFFNSNQSKFYIGIVLFTEPSYIKTSAVVLDNEDNLFRIPFEKDARPGGVGMFYNIV